METHGVPDPRRQTAACGAGLLEEIQRREPSNRRAGRTQRPQVGACVAAGLCPARAGDSPSPHLPWWIDEIDGDHALSCRSVAVESVGLKPPLLDGGNRRPPQNKISPNNFQILDAAIAPNQ